MRSTHTYAALEVSSSTYDEIRALLEAAGYEHAFLEDGAIDMHGIGLTRASAAEDPRDALVRPLESLVAACEAAFTSPDTDMQEDADDDVSIPGIGITYRQIWLARDAVNQLAVSGSGVGA